ncbi:hypothetical protein [Bradyrhizobium liaoningense]|uniref:hypothetical protein n=1 Tax=Bradyrhizobium liaoningense TaxID=43992 RepID=UPI001BAE438C|nr:hypothetical protein [Bradyrhizobium liaoningense]MBR0715070.1 hypothetical protein [Bradyrhizobium liaoningense]
MRWKISRDHDPRHHDPRQIDLFAIIALLILVAASIWYLAASFTATPSTTAFIVPSQNVRW